MYKSKESVLSKLQRPRFEIKMKLRIFHIEIEKIAKKSEALSWAIRNYAGYLRNSKLNFGERSQNFMKNFINFWRLVSKLIESVRDKKNTDLDSEYFDKSINNYTNEYVSEYVQKNFSEEGFKNKIKTFKQILTRLENDLNNALNK